VTARFALARSTGAAAALLSRATGRGGGTTIGGRVTLLVDPGALEHAAVGREIALVSGTNGKSTTRTLLVAALQTREPVVSNGGGANLPTGLTAALSRDRTSRVGVLEVDEPYLPRVAAAVKPRAAVLLNLSRDQLDRYAEVRRLAGIWHDALVGSPETVAVANCDDPLVAWAATGARETIWVAAGQRWTMDATACPVCGDVLVRDGARWRSDGCGLTRPDPAWTVEGRRVTAPDGTSYDVDLAIPGDVNVGNAALAAAAASLWSVEPAAALGAMKTIGAVDGRYLETTYAGRPVRLLLAKNPAGWVEALAMTRPEVPVVVAVNARAQDGRDPSWLWDVPFEVLRGRHAVATGERSRDVAVRLRYAGVEHVRVDDEAQALRGAHGSGPIEVLANYSAFQTFRRVVGDA
jgi:lipid II isoglutaminyl synthase (glutamine-hydrolysing)